MGSCFSTNKMHLDSPVLLIDGFQRLYTSETHPIIKDISRMILTFYIHNTSVYHIGIRNPNYYTKIYKTTIFDPILTSRICDICDDGDNMFIYQINGNIDCYKLPINIESKRVKNLSFGNVKTMQFVNETCHSDSLLAFVQNNKPNYIGIVENNKGVYIKFNDTLKINRIYIGNATSDYSKIYIFDENEEIHEIKIKTLEYYLNNGSSSSFSSNLHFIKPKYLIQNKHIRIIDIVSNEYVTFLIDQNGVVYGRCISEHKTKRETKLLGDYFKNNNDFDVLQTFYKDNDCYIRIKKIVLTKYYAIALDNNGCIYIWGDTEGLIENNNESVAHRLDIIIKDEAKDKIEIKCYKNPLYSDEKVDDSMCLKFDDIASGYNHSFIISNEYQICIGWGIYNWIGTKLADKTVGTNNVLRCSNGELGLLPTRITLIENLMRQNSEIKLYAVSDQTYIVVTHY